jgi:anti-sigma regulatory factor (Ser/Thr protein kinase)/ActR/RegA family two-component response regulator
MGRLLAICRDAATIETLRSGLAAAGHECEICAGNVEAVRRLRERAFDLVLTDPLTALAEDLALVAELREARPGTRVMVLAPAASQGELIGALRAQVFACFTPPFDWSEIVSLVQQALTEPDWRHGIEVVSGLPYWITLRVSCHLLTAERLVIFMTEYEQALPVPDRELLMTAFREMLLNAMEHGTAFDREKVVEVTAARTERAIVYHFRDPGPGFDRADLAHAVQSTQADHLWTGTERREQMGLRHGGFGMLMVRSIVDELVYNERGNEVLLIKHLR